MKPKSTKETEMTKSNTKRAETVSAPIVQQKLDDKGRKAEVLMNLEEFDGVIKKHGLTTKSAKIRYLAGEGYSPSAIAKYLGVIYQHVRNVLNQPMKKAVVQAPAEAAVKGE